MPIPLRDSDGVSHMRLVSMALCVLPVICCAALTYRYGIDAPYMDAWWYLPLVEKAFHGTLHLSDFWLSVNEHRVVAPAIVTVALARLTHWDMRAEHAATLFFALLAYSVIARRLLRIERTLATRGTLWFLPVGALLAFNYAQYAIWGWGLHLMITFTLLATVSALHLLAVHPLRRNRFVAALVVAVVATFSFGAGVAVWPAGVVVLLCDPRTLRRKGPALAVWCAVALGAAAVYWGSHTPSRVDTNAAQSVLRPHTLILYLLAYLGGPLAASNATLAIVTGASLIVGYGWLAATHTRRPEESWDTWAFVWGLAAMAAAAGFLTALKQAPEGALQATSSRYLIWPTPAWIGLVFALYLCRDRARAEGGRRRMQAVAAIAATIAALSATTYAVGVYRADEVHDAFAIGREALRTGAPEDDFHWLYPNPQLPIEWRERLIRERLTIFRNPDALTRIQ